MLHRIYTLIIKEIIALIRDPHGRSLLIIPPLVQLIIFAHASTLEVKNIRIAVFNQDNGVYSNELVHSFTGSSYFTKIIFVNSMDEATGLIESEKVIGIVSINQKFSRDILSNKTGTLQVIIDGRNSNSAQIVLGYISQIASTLSQDIAKKLARPMPKSIIITRHWYNPNLNFNWFTVPNLLGILLTMSGVVITGLAIAREKEMGTFDQLLISPLSPVEIILGKVIPSVLVGLFQGTLLFVTSIVFYQIPFNGSLLLLYLSIIVFVLSISGIGVFISSLCSSQQQAVLGSFVFISPAMMLSGFATPVENMPEFLQIISMMDPIRHFLVIVKGIYFKEMSFAEVFSNMIPLFYIGLFTMTFAVWFFRRKTS